MRQIVLDTETTGLDPAGGHRIIEIGCVEMVNRRLTGQRFHQYINPQREVDEGAAEVHGMTLEDLRHNPVFSEISDDFLAFVNGGELIIHNAPFDVGFINAELARLTQAPADIGECCQVLDTLELARRLHPGQRNSLDALCQRYGIDNTQRQLHGALLDAEILADVYLAMTGGQVALFAGDSVTNGDGGEQRHAAGRRPVAEAEQPRRVIRASEEEAGDHARYLEQMAQSAGRCLWPPD